MGSIITFFAVLFGITILAIILSVIKAAGRVKNDARIEIRKLVTTDPFIVTGMERAVYDLYISGVKHHCTDKDIGIFTGAVYNEKSNPKDKKAMAIINAQKKILGYIPAKRLDEYWDWSGGETLYCAGYIFWNGNMLLGRVRIYPNSEDESNALKDAEEYLYQVVSHFKWELKEDGTMK